MTEALAAAFRLLTTLPVRTVHARQPAETRPKPVRRLANERRRAKRLYARGLSFAKVARAMKISKATARRYVQSKEE